MQLSPELLRSTSAPDGEYKERMVAYAGAIQPPRSFPALRSGEVVMNLRVPRSFGPSLPLSIRPHDFFMQTLLYPPW